MSVEDRTKRAALADDMTVIAAKDDDTATVISDGDEYTVDPHSYECECADAEHRDPEGGCKHVRRARMALGLDETPGAADLGRFPDPAIGSNIVESPADVIETTEDGRPVDCRCNPDPAFGLQRTCPKCRALGFWGECNPDGPLSEDEQDTSMLREEWYQ